MHPFLHRPSRRHQRRATPAAAAATATAATPRRRRRSRYHRRQWLHCTRQQIWTLPCQGLKNPSIYFFFFFFFKYRSTLRELAIFIFFVHHKKYRISSSAYNSPAPSILFHIFFVQILFLILLKIWLFCQFQNYRYIDRCICQPHMNSAEWNLLKKNSKIVETLSSNNLRKSKCYRILVFLETLWKIYLFAIF